MALQSGYKKVLGKRLAPGDTEMVVSEAPYIQQGRVYLKSGSQEEWISFSSVEGTTLKGLVRQLSTTVIPVVSEGDGYTWLAGTPVRIVAMHDQMTDKTELLSDENTWTGINHWEGDTEMGGVVDMKGNVTIKSTGKLTAEGPAHPAPTVLNTTARDELYPSPVAGDLVYVTELNALQIYNGETAQWESFGISTPTPSATESSVGTVRFATQEEADTNEGVGVIQASKNPVMYGNFAFKTVTGNVAFGGNNMCLEITPDNNFTITAGENLKVGAEYILRVHSQSTVRTITLGTGVTNPFGDVVKLVANKDTTMVFFATSNNALELWTIRTAV